MSERFDFFPSGISLNPYLSSQGKAHRDTAVSNLDKAIIALENAIVELQKLQGLGTELYIARLQKEIDTYRTLRNVIRNLA